MVPKGQPTRAFKEVRWRGTAKLGHEWFMDWSTVLPGVAGRGYMGSLAAIDRGVENPFSLNAKFIILTTKFDLYLRVDVSFIIRPHSRKRW